MTTTKKTTTSSRKSSTTTRKPVAKKTTSPKVAKPVTEKIELTSSSYVHEIFAAVVAERTKDKKIGILQQYNENFLKSLLIWNFDDSIVSVLPEGEVPIQENENAEKSPSSNIRKEWSKFYNFVKGGNDAMNRLRKETMFINMLESFHPGEAEVLCLVKDKKLQTKYNITKELVSEAYPDIQWGNRS
jgi:hypothetical protein